MFQATCLHLVRTAFTLWCRCRYPTARPAQPLPLPADGPQGHLAHHDVGASDNATWAGSTRAFRSDREVSSTSHWSWGLLLKRNVLSIAMDMWWRTGLAAAGAPGHAGAPTAMVYEHAVRRGHDSARLVILTLAPDPPATVPAVTPHKVLYAELRVGPRQPSKRVVDVSPFINARIVSFHAAHPPSCGGVTLRQLVGVLRACHFAGGDVALPAMDDPGMSLMVVMHDLKELRFNTDDVIGW